jgi:hypothetical protein
LLGYFLFTRYHKFLSLVPLNAVELDVRIETNTCCGWFIRCIRISSCVPASFKKSICRGLTLVHADNSVFTYASPPVVRRMVTSSRFFRSVNILIGSYRPVVSRVVFTHDTVSPVPYGHYWVPRALSPRLHWSWCNRTSVPRIIPSAGPSPSWISFGVFMDLVGGFQFSTIH